MTAIHKGEPRYVIASATGYTIRPGVHEAGSRAEMTSYTVLDRAYNHRIVASFNATTRTRQALMLQRAQMVCDALNQGQPVPWWDHHGDQRYGPPKPPTRPGNHRKFDWAEAHRLHETGLSLRLIGQRLGVTKTAIRHALSHHR